MIYLYYNINTLKYYKCDIIYKLYDIIYLYIYFDHFYYLNKSFYPVIFVAIYYVLVVNHRF